MSNYLIIFRYVRHLDMTVLSVHIKTKLCQVIDAMMRRRDDLAFRQVFTDICFKLRGIQVTQNFMSSLFGGERFSKEVLEAEVFLLQRYKRSIIDL